MFKCHFFGVSLKVVIGNYNYMVFGNQEYIEIDTSLSSKCITRVLERIILERGKTSIIRTDNGPEFASKELELWSKDSGIKIQFIQPGRPMENGYNEQFNRIYRECIFDVYLFFELDQ